MIGPPRSSPLFPYTPLFRPQGTKVTVGPPFFNQVNIPLGLALLALTGIGPLIAWRRASLPNLRRQFAVPVTVGDRKSTRLNSSHSQISYAVFCLKKKKTKTI